MPRRTMFKNAYTVIEFSKKGPLPLLEESWNSILRKSQLKQTLSLVASIQRYKWENPVSLRFPYKSMFTLEIFWYHSTFPRQSMRTYQWSWILCWFSCPPRLWDWFLVTVLWLNQGNGLSSRSVRAWSRNRAHQVTICLSRSHVSQAG